MNIMKQKREKKHRIKLNNLGEEIELVAFIIGILKVSTQFDLVQYTVVLPLQNKTIQLKIYTNKIKLNKKTTKNTKNITFMNSPNEKFKGGRAKLFIIFFFPIDFYSL